MLLELLLDAFPDGTSIPKSHYDVKKMLRDFGLGYDSIHACSMIVHYCGNRMRNFIIFLCVVSQDIKMERSRKKCYDIFH